MRTLLLAAAVLALAAPQPTLAASSRTASQACVWHTWFYGERERLNGWRDYFSRAPCFATEAGCKAWLYEVQTTYPEMMNFKPCRRG